ncbi:TPA: hypothetical protein N2B41_005746 [Pseudomonas aeruginosa]|nr:hypothetical protein [Pseudomonas aeruginosa]HCL3697156.1 hypothetical protein [Pseudomonas aeruginosa]
MKCLSTEEDLAAHLKRQLIFLRNSVSAYDNGCVEEAIRIGVVIRVLCHDTQSSVSLLKQMGQKATLRLVTTAETLSSDLLADMDFGELMAGMTFGHTLEYDLVPEDAPAILCADWWEQPVFIRDKKTYTRKDVVLAAANKDGGAHVDNPDAKLQALQEGFWIRTVTHADGTKKTEPLVDNHFRMLRRFAEELLSSKELLKLAD